MGFMKRLLDIIAKHFYSIVIVVTILRVAVCLVLGDRAVHSAEDYLIATNLVKGNGYEMIDGVPTAFKAPVVPFVFSLGIIIADVLGVSSKVLLTSLQHLLFSIVALLLASLTECLSRRGNISTDHTIIGRFAGILFLLHPSYLVYPQTLESTTLFVFISCALLRWWFVLPKTLSIHHWIISGLSSGILILTQPVSLPLVFIALLWLLYKSESTRRVYHGLIIVLACIIVMCPWIVRNYEVFGKFIPTKSVAWMNLYVGFDVMSHGNQALTMPDSTTKHRIDSLSLIYSDTEMEDEYRSAVIAIISENPASYIIKTCIQAGRYWTLPPRYTMNGINVGMVIIRIVPQIVLSFFIVLSYRYLWSNYRSLCIVTFWLMFYFTIVYASTQTANIRFKLDSEWMLIPLSALGAGAMVRTQFSTLEKS
jgi:4-amino-4-deoxy-L-arabinose transferase-like glycosyltransferase